MRFSIDFLSAPTSASIDGNMFLTGKKTLFFVAFVLLIFFVAVPSEAFGLDKQESTKAGYKKTRLVSGKSVKHKESQLSQTDDTEDRANKNVDLNRVELTAQKITDAITVRQELPKLQNANLQHARSSKNKENGDTANRLRRNVDSSVVQQSELTTTDSVGYKLGKKNYKKFKPVDNQMGSKSAKSKKSSIHIAKPKRDTVFTNNRALRVNATDYYAQRKAVMERFYARQRAIAERYAKNVTSTPRTLFKYDLSPGLPATSASPRKIQDEDTRRDRNASESTANKDTYFYVTERTSSNPEEIKTTERVTTVPQLSDNLRPDLGAISPESSNNVERDAADYPAPTVDCKNQPLSGSFSRKDRKKVRTDCNEQQRDTANLRTDRSPSRSPGGPASDDQAWGECEGDVVYQHNLLLGLKGPSNLDTTFEVIIQGPLCISCVEALRYNRTRAMVSLHSGGRGHDFAKLQLKGFENEGFSYIVKVWGVRRDGDDCRYMTE